MSQFVWLIALLGTYFVLYGEPEKSEESQLKTVENVDAPLLTELINELEAEEWSLPEKPSFPSDNWRLEKQEWKVNYIVLDRHQLGPKSSLKITFHQSIPEQLTGYNFCAQDGTSKQISGYVSDDLKTKNKSYVSSPVKCSNGDDYSDVVMIQMVLMLSDRKNKSTMTIYTNEFKTISFTKPDKSGR